MILQTSSLKNMDGIEAKQVPPQMDKASSFGSLVNSVTGDHTSSIDTPASEDSGGNSVLEENMSNLNFNSVAEADIREGEKYIEDDCEQLKLNGESLDSNSKADSVTLRKTPDEEASNVDTTESPRPYLDTSGETSECPSSPVDRGSVNSQLSMVSDTGSGYDPEYSMSRESSFAFLRENSAMSTVSTGSSSQEFFSARESLASTASSSANSSNRVSSLVIQPGELTNELVEGPLITLPPAQRSHVPPIPQSPVESEPPTPTAPPAADTPTTPVAASPLSDVPQTDEIVSVSQQSTSTSSDGKSTNTENIPQAPAPTGNAEATTPATADAPPADTSNNGQKCGKSTTAPATTSASSATQTAAAAKPRVKKTPNDFIFGKVIGEGSYSTVSISTSCSL